MAIPERANPALESAGLDVGSRCLRLRNQRWKGGASPNPFFVSPYARGIEMEKVQIGSATLYLGDCREILPTLPRFDACITDPPYGLGEKMKGGTKRFRTGEGGLNTLGAWDAAPVDGLMELLLPSADVLMVWGGNYYDMPASRGWLIWVKTNSVPTMASIEMCWTNRDMNSKHFEHACGGWDREHPTQKPIALMHWCIERAADAATIVDPFMGSGTTGVAAIEMGRQFVGIELERKYFDIACQRLERASAQGRMFADEGFPCMNAEQMGFAA